MVIERVQKWEIDRSHIWVWLNKPAVHVADRIVLSGGEYLCHTLCGEFSKGVVITHSTGYFVRNTMERGRCRKCVAALKEQMKAKGEVTR